MGRLKGKARQKANKKARNQAKYKRAVYKKTQIGKILKWGDPTLEINCERVLSDDDPTEVIAELKKVLSVTDTGVGLAAPQIGHTKRIIALRPNRITGDIKILINPHICEESAEKVTGKEGCLSYPNFFTDVERCEWVVVMYEDEKRQEKKKKYTGTEAIIVQHEIDHIFGICQVGDAWKKYKEEQEDKLRQKVGSTEQE